MEVEPASLQQVQRGRNGEMVAIDDDVQSIARDLREINPALRLRYSEAGEHFVVYRIIHLPNGGSKEELVTTARQLDQRIVNRVRQVGSDSYDFAKDLASYELEAKRADEHATHERIGPGAEQLAHAMRKDLDVQHGRIFVPGGLER